MAWDSVPAFVDAIYRSRILDAGQTDDLRDNLLFRFRDPRNLAWHLIASEWITAYQVNQLNRGNGLDLSLGDYVILDRLGQGGVGEVLKARRRTDDRIAALKVIRPHLLADVEAVRQFLWEVQVLGRMNHPNVVATFDSGRAGGRCYFAMEFVEGAPLRTLIKRAGPLPPALAANYLRQTALGLEHAHQHGFVHRDLKPANLFLSLSSGQTEQITLSGWESVPRAALAPIKILDWGLAQLGTSSSSAPAEGSGPSSGPLGTVDYLSPEQAIDHAAVDVRSDIYSLGCTFYYLLTGVPPFPGGSIMQRVLKHRQEEPIPIHAHRPDLPAALEAVLQKMMAKRPADRFQTPTELAEALANLDLTVAGEPLASTVAGPTPGPEASPADRRKSLRHPCEFQCSCRPVTEGVGVSWPVQIMDVSRTGIGLRVERRFEIGSLLEIDLNFDEAVLARVTNLRADTDGFWIVGGLFATPLGDEELWHIRAEQVRPPATTCRAWVRFVTGPVQARPEADLADTEPRPARVVNVAPGGITLLLPSMVSAGTQLQLELLSVPHRPPLVKQARVIRVTDQPDGEWLVGCAFTGELSETELNEITDAPGADSGS